MTEFDTNPEAPQRRKGTSPQGDSVRLTVQKVTQALQAGLGQALIAGIVNCDVTTLSLWASGAVNPPPTQERLLRDTYQVFEMVAQADSPTVAGAWLMGMNPLLDDRTPAEAIAEGDFREVMAAARSFAAGN